MRKIKWSPTRLESVNHCMMYHFLKYHEGETSPRMSYYAKGSLIHNLAQHFRERLAKPGQKVVRNRNGPRYSNAEEFGDYARRKWLHLCIVSEESTNPDSKIVWTYENEKWVIAENMRDICYNVFPLLVNEDPPLRSEKPYNFSIGGKSFKGTIDDIRKRSGKGVIRDYKSGNPHLQEMKRDFDPQLTIYSVALAASLSTDVDLARALNLEERIGEFEKGKLLVVPDITLEYFMFEAPNENRLMELESRRDRKTPPKSLPVIQTTTRSDNHFLEIIKRIDYVEQSIERGEVVAERGRKCDRCDLRHACKKKLENVGQDFYEDRKGQFNLEITIPNFAKSEPKIPKSKRRRKDPDQTHFAWRYNKPTPGK